MDALWALFAEALRFAGNEEVQDDFVMAFDNVVGRTYVGWKHTIGCYWTRPWKYMPLDSPSRSFITGHLGIHIGSQSSKLSGNRYLDILDALKQKFQDASSPFHLYSIPELCRASWRQVNESHTGADEYTSDEQILPPAPHHYDVEDILTDGCFLDRPRLEQILGQLKGKKNLILQGPPGTGKTWLSKRLAWALIGRKDSKRVRAVQFHPNLSYEDFVRG